MTELTERKLIIYLDYKNGTYKFNVIGAYKRLN